MSDLYSNFVNSRVGERVAGTLGLPKPAPLRRYQLGAPTLDGPMLVGGTGRVLEHVRVVASRLDIPVHTHQATSEASPEGMGSELPPPAADNPAIKYAALVFDATGVTTSADLQTLHTFFNDTIRRLGPNGRVIVLATPPNTATDPREHAAQRALEGFVRSLAKELRAGSTAQLLHVHRGAEAGAAAALRFVLSARSAYVSGQTITVGPASAHPPIAPANLDAPLEGKVAVVTGAGRGIGESIVRVLARDGATVVGVDLPMSGNELATVMNSVGGTALQLDVTAPDAPTKLIEHVKQRHGGLDIMVNNAGVTRDKTIAGMSQSQWDLVMAVNLTAIENINEALLESDVLNANSRIICVASMSGIAGNRGQTNYGASKAGVIGHVAAMATQIGASGGTINAVAPGFIETEMTNKMPPASREIGRRINSLSQGGKPVDVAETIAFFAGQDAVWINGTTLRVCGQNLLGA